MYQTHLTEYSIKSIYLVAVESPRKAWWYLELFEVFGNFFLFKASGIENRRLDLRQWPMPDLATAEKEFDRRVRQKLDPRRKKRKYKKKKPPEGGFR